MDAEAPFGSSAIADAILRSSNSIDFHVLGAFLYYVSPTFRDMFSLNRGPSVYENAKKGELPIIDVSEDSEILQILLVLIYPCVDEPQFRNLEVFRAASKAAQKYFMIVVEDKLKKQIATSEFMKVESFRLYMIAVDLGWEAVALTAAHATLGIPLEKLPFVDELQDISGAQFYRFLEYRFRCEKQLSNHSQVEFVILPKSTNPSCQADENTSETISRAPAPFGTPTNGNIILRSSDSIDFFVIEGLIRSVSPVFDSKFPLQEPDEVDGRPVITVSEDSKVLDGLLGMIYPHADQVDTQDCHLFKRMVQAARKYEMSIVEKKLQKLGENLASKEPLRMYVIATTLGLKEVATIAAFNTLSQPLEDMLFIEELKQITGADLFRLMRYRFSCAKEVFKVLGDRDVHVKHGFTNLVRLVQGQPSGMSFGCLTTPVPIITHGLRQRLKNCPRGATYRAIFVAELPNLAGCDSAARMPISAVDATLNYRDGIAAAIEDAASKISLADVLNPSAFEDVPEPNVLEGTSSFFGTSQSAHVWDGEVEEKGNKWMGKETKHRNYRK